MKALHRSAYLAPILAAVCLQASAPASRAALVHHYPFDSDASDVVGGINGVFVGGTSVGSDPQRGNALLLNGVDGYLRLATSLVPGEDTSTATFTIGAWVKVAGISNSADSAIYGEFNDTTNSRNSLTIRHDTGHPGWVQYPPSNGDLLAAKSVVDNSWHHVAYVQNEPGMPSRQIYIDGQLAASDNVTPEGYSGSPPTSFAIGGRLGKATNGVLPSLVGGAIDDFRVYDNALSAAQIADLVPEPSVSLLFLAGAVVGLCVAGRRRRGVHAWGG